MAIDSFQRVVEIARERRDTQQETEAYLGLGSVYMMERTLQMAEEYFEKGLKLAKKRGDAQQEANAYIGLGVFYKSSGQSQKAVEFFENAKERGNTPTQVKQAYLGLGLSYISSGQFHEASECFDTYKAFELRATGSSHELSEFNDREKPYKTNLKELDIKHSEQKCKLEATGMDLGLGESVDDREKCLETVEHSGQEYKFSVDNVNTFRKFASEHFTQ